MDCVYVCCRCLQVSTAGGTRLNYEQFTSNDKDVVDVI